MATYGSSASLARLLGPYGLATILELICHAYDALVISGAVTDRMGEVEITEELAVHLANQCRQSGIGVFPITEKIDKSRSRSRGKPPTIDLALRRLYDRQRYIGFECKVVFYASKRHYDDYINEGVQRHVAGKYSSMSRAGGMIAYVRRGKPRDVADDLSRRVALMSGAIVTASSVPPGANCVGFDSKHTRIGLVPLRLVHMFFDCQLKHQPRRASRKPA